MKQDQAGRRCGVATLVVLAICGSLFCRPAFGEVFLVKDGQPNAEIVISDNPSRTTRLAASELQTYLEKISGGKLPVTNVASHAVPVKLYVGKSKYTDELKLSDGGLKYGAYRMASGKDWLVLLGYDQDFKTRDNFIGDEAGRPKYYEKWDALTLGKWSNPVDRDQYSDAVKISAFDGRGSLNAVYAFLGGLGVRWYFPGDLGEVVPHLTSVAFQPVDKTVSPDFPLRQLCIYYNNFPRASKDFVMWQLRLGLNENEDFGGGHGLINVIGRDKTHPEYFALYGGKRSTEEPFGLGFPCLSSEGLREATEKYCRAVFKIYPDVPMLSIAPPDGYSTLCECDLCKGKGTPERGWNGRLSDYVWSFEDRVARDLYKTNPDRKVTAIAYSVYQLPPEKIATLSPNLAVVLCRWRSEFYNTQIRDEFRKLTEAWLEKMPSKDLYVWDYYLHNRPDGPWVGVPVYYPRLIAEDLRSLKGKSRGEFIEVYSNWKADGYVWNAMAANHLNCYVTARLWWDANQDIDALLADYYEKFYGPAAKEMKAFIEYAEANWMKATKDVAVIDRLFELLGSARKAAGNAIYGQRVDLLVVYMERLKATREIVARGREKTLPKAQALERNKADLQFDGKLDDKFWEGMPEYSMGDVATGKAPASKTTFRVGYSDNALYFGIRCEDADMKHLYVAAKEDGDANLFNGDNIELLIETQVHSYYQIAFSPAGAVMNMDRKNGGYNSKWKSGVEARAHTGDGFWSLELRVPVAGENAEAIDALNGIAGAKPTEAAPWHFNLCRQRMRDTTRELWAFSPTGEDSFHELMKFGPLTVK
jgi:hypothetical protein